VALEVLLPLPDGYTVPPPPAPPAPAGLLPLPELRAFEVLAAGGTVAEAAARAGVHRNTVARWTREGAPLAAALAELRRERLAAARARLVAAAGGAVEVLAELAADPCAPPAVRVRAACALLDRAGLGPRPEPEPPPDPEPDPDPCDGARVLALLDRLPALLAALPSLPEPPALPELEAAGAVIQGDAPAGCSFPVGPDTG
jgi:hypothetical protein